MSPHDLLFHLRTHFAAELGPRGVRNLSPNCGTETAAFRASLACEALRSRGVADVPAYAGPDWLEAGRRLVEAELHGTGPNGLHYCLQPEHATKTRARLRSTLTPDGLLQLLCNTNEAVRRAERAYAAARRDGLLSTSDRAAQQQYAAASLDCQQQTGHSYTDLYTLK